MGVYRLVFRSGEMGAFRLPIADRGHPPAFTVVGHAAHQHAEQLSLLTGGFGMKPKLHQQAAALEPWAPAGEMKREVQRFRFSPLPGLGIIAPRGEIRLGCRKLPSHQVDGGCERLGLINAANRLSCVQNTDPQLQDILNG